MGDERATQIDVYVQRAWLPKLAPLVECVSALSERRLPPNTAELAPLRCTLRKLLAFDGIARSSANNACGLLVMAALAPSLLIFSEGSRVALPALVLVVLLLLGATKQLHICGARARDLNRLFTKCVVQLARVTRRTPHTQPKALDRHWTLVSLEYSCGGAGLSTDVYVIERASELLGETVAVIVDPESPQACFIRDLHV